ncbi:hypothetical protein ACFQO7_12610 [Catellatospora aurea]|uniref:Intradiol ring-cleavage dioxygenases domain-containing protein n=1 Tax=Catellatospora aurea TaxID=1337874 RepID=A0ABW2GTW0_9ACTN
MGHDHEGQRVSRRSIFAGISAVGLGSLLAACGDGTPATTTSGEPVSPDATTSADLTGLFTDANTCKLSPSTTQGPYYFDADKIRSDIREDRAGTRLRVVLKVQDSEQCKPVTNAVVEIWHCGAVRGAHRAGHLQRRQRHLPGQQADEGHPGRRRLPGGAGAGRRFRHRRQLTRGGHGIGRA